MGTLIFLKLRIYFCIITLNTSFRIWICCSSTFSEIFFISFRFWEAGFNLFSLILHVKCIFLFSFGKAKINIPVLILQILPAVTKTKDHLSNVYRKVAHYPFNCLNICMIIEPGSAIFAVVHWTVNKKYRDLFICRYLWKLTTRIKHTSWTKDVVILPMKFSNFRNINLF